MSHHPIIYLLLFTLDFSAGDLTARLDDMVGSMALLSAELHTTQRQQASLQYLLNTAELRATGVVPKVAAEVAELREHLRDFGAVTAQQLRAIQDVERQLAERRQPSAGVPSSECVRDGDEMTARQRTQDDGFADVPLVSGSAAINVARRACAAMQQLRRRLAEVAQEREQLAEQLEAEGEPRNGMRPLATPLTGKS
jgi:hypothetical protein